MPFGLLSIQLYLQSLSQRGELFLVLFPLLTHRFGISDILYKIIQIHSFILLQFKQIMSGIFSIFSSSDDLEEATVILKNILSKQEQKVYHHSWSQSSKKSKNQYHKHCVNLMNRLYQFQGDKESLYQIRDFMLSLLTNKSKIIKQNSKNIHLLQLQKYIEEKAQKMSDERVKDLQEKLQVFQKIFEGDIHNIQNYTQRLDEKIIKNITKHYKIKIIKYEKIYKAIKEYGREERKKKFKQLLDQNNFNSEQWQNIIKFSERLEKQKNLKIKSFQSEDDEKLSIFVSQLKTKSIQESPIIESCLENDTTGSYTYFLQKIKELNRLKELLPQILQKNKLSVQYETIFSFDTKNCLQKMLKRMQKLRQFETLQKQLYGKQGFRKYFSYIEEVNKNLSKLQKRYDIKDITSSNDNSYYKFYIKLSGIIAFFEKKARQNQNFKTVGEDSDEVEKLREKMKEIQKRQREEYQNKIQEQFRTIRQLRQQQEFYKQTVKRYNKTISQQSIMNNQKQIEMKQEIQRLQRQARQFNDKMEEERENVKRITQQKQQKELELDSIKEQLQKKIIQNQGLEKKVASNKIPTQTHLFCGDILSSYESSGVSQLTQQIQKISQKSFLRTKLLYQMDLKNKTNFHQYFDNHNNIAIIVKLQNGMIIGGYGNGLFNKQYKGDGIIFNVSKKMYFNLQEKYNTKAFMYDGYHLIIGNSQIRIQFASNVAFSNFGIVSRYFDTKKHTLEEFMGEDNRQLKIESYEVHEIVLT